MADRNQLAVLQQMLKKCDAQRIAGVNQLLAVLIEHHEGKCELSIPVFEKICQTSLIPQPELTPTKLILTVCTPDGKPAIANPQPRISQEQAEMMRNLLEVITERPPIEDLNEACVYCGLDRGDHRDECPIGLAIQLLERMKFGGVVLADRVTPPAAEAEPEKPTERCPECAWAYGTHRPDCSLATQAVGA